VFDSVGESIKDFKLGEEVFSLAGMSNREGTFERVLQSLHILLPRNLLL
jgi:hypothetical protein